MSLGLAGYLTSSCVFGVSEKGLSFLPSFASFLSWEPLLQEMQVAAMEVPPTTPAAVVTRSELTSAALSSGMRTCDIAVVLKGCRHNNGGRFGKICGPICLSKLCTRYFL